MDNLILIGMPGVGKSTIGVILAKVLGYKFIDTDLIIQEKENRLLSDIISKNGVEQFIEIENNVCKNIDVDKCVIATGGSVIYGKEAMEHLKKIGRIIYLKQDFTNIKNRVNNLNGRGVVLKNNQTFEDLYNERVPLYEKYADIIIEEGNLSVEETLKQIISKI